MRWLQRKPKVKPEAPIQVVMYTRAGCHLCDEAWALLREMKSKYAFELEAIDVDTQTELVEQFGNRVPVVFVEGAERFWGPINRVLLVRLFESMSR